MDQGSSMKVASSSSEELAITEEMLFPSHMHFALSCAEDFFYEEDGEDVVEQLRCCSQEEPAEQPTLQDVREDADRLVMPVPATEEEDESHGTAFGLTTHSVDENGLAAEDRGTAQEDHLPEPVSASPNYDLHSDGECQSLSLPKAFSPEAEKNATGEAANETHDLVPIYRAASVCLPARSCTTLGAEPEESSFEDTTTTTQTQLTSGGSDASSAAIEDFSHFATPLDSQSDDSCFGDSQEDVKCLQDLTEAPPSRDVSGCDEATFEETTTATQAQLTSGGSDASSSAIEETSHFDTTPDSQVPACDEPMPAATPQRLAAAVPTRSPADPAGSCFLRAAAATAPGGSPRPRRRQSRISGATRSQSESRSRRPALLTDRCHRSGKEQRAGERMAVRPKDLLGFDSNFDHGPAFADLGMKAREYVKELRTSHVVDMEPADTLAFPECRHVSLMAMLPAYAMKERRLPPPKGAKSGGEVSYRGGWNPTRSEKCMPSPGYESLAAAAAAHFSGTGTHGHYLWTGKPRLWGPRSSVGATESLGTAGDALTSKEQQTCQSDEDQVSFTRNSDHEEQAYV
eukprot:s2262_g6.t2